MLFLTVSMGLIVSTCNHHFGPGTCRKSGSGIKVRVSKIPSRLRPMKTKKKFVFISGSKARSIYSNYLGGR